MDRRTFINNIGILSAAQISHKQNFSQYFIGSKKIGACDWSLGKSANIEAFDIAKAIGLSGIQVNMGSLSNNLRLRETETQKSYLLKSKETGVKITSLAIGELNNVPYKSDSRTDQWVIDSIDVANNFDVKVILLAFFNKNDLRNDPSGIDAVIGKLKEAAPKAEKMGITLGIESYLKAEEHLQIMEKIGSNAIKVYYDFRNSKDAGNDIYNEIKLLGNSNICEIHIKENGKFLGQGDINWQKVCVALEEIDYSKKKWKQIEWSLPTNYDYTEGFQKNLKFLKDIK